MTNKEEILRALKTIQNVCKEHLCCDDCPLEKNGWCVVQDQEPEDWKINDTDKIWRAFK